LVRVAKTRHLQITVSINRPVCGFGAHARHSARELSESLSGIREFHTSDFMRLLRRRSSRQCRRRDDTDRRHTRCKAVVRIRTSTPAIVGHVPAMGGTDMFATLSPGQQMFIVSAIGFGVFVLPVVAAIIAVWLIRRRDQAMVPGVMCDAMVRPEDASIQPVA